MDWSLHNLEIDFDIKQVSHTLRKLGTVTPLNFLAKVRFVARVFQNFHSLFIAVNAVPVKK